MGTKLKPGRFDCYEKAFPSEPMFVLLARDKDAPLLVRLWAELRMRAGEDPDVVGEALICAYEMEAWRARNREGV